MGGEGVTTPLPSDDAPSPFPTSQLPWSAIPKFTPGTTNVQDYVRKLRFLANVWPSDRLDLLAPRAALLVEGSAFAKVSRIEASKLKVKSLDGVKALVAAIDGSWGATEFDPGGSPGLCNVASKQPGRR